MKRAALAMLLLLVACDDKKEIPVVPPPSAAPPNPSSVIEALKMDAGVFETTDPPAPAGDLKAEIDRFTTVDACVAEKAKLDPLVGDALRAIGYDTFLRDACRQLEAARDKKREVCEKIDSSALRKQCRSWVAIVSQTPDACPSEVEGAPGRGRAPTCVAVAAKDPRLCAGEARTSERATCEALTTRDDTKCDVLLPSAKPACKREVARWHSLLGAPLEGLPKLPAPRGKLVVHGADGTNDPPAPETNLAGEYARGAVVSGARARSKVELGALAEVDPMRIPGGPNKRVRVGVSVVFDQNPTSIKDEPKTSLDRFELELPGEAPIVCGGSSSSARCDLKLVSAHADKTRGGEASVAVKGKVSSGGKTYDVDLTAATFVRDVVTEEFGGPRLVPPGHPALAGSNPTFLQ